MQLDPLGAPADAAPTQRLLVRVFLGTSCALPDCATRVYFVRSREGRTTNEFERYHDNKRRRDHAKARPIEDRPR